MRQISKLLLIGLLLYPMALLAQKTDEDVDASDDEPIQNTGAPFQFTLKNRPSIRIGEFAQIDF